MAADRIKGITIKIGGDTTELQDALADVNKSLKSTQADLKDVNKLLKLDPKNTELLAQKQRLLSNAVTGTKDKLKTLQDAQKQMGDTSAFTPQQQREYDALQREIISTEADLKKLEKQTKENDRAMSAFTKVGDAFGNIGEKAGAAGKKLLPVTAAITGLTAAAGAAWTEVDAAEDKVRTMTGAMGADFEGLAETMKTVATSVPTSFDTAATAVGEINTRFGLTGDALETLSEQFIKFAELNEQDVTSAIDGVQEALAAYDEPAENAAGVLDMLTLASQKSGVSTTDLMTALLENRTVFGEMGLSIEDAVSFLAMLETSGANSSEVLGGLKKAMQNANKEGQPLSEALADVQASMTGAATETEGMQTAIDLFGAKSGPALYRALSSGKVNLADFAGYLDGWEGTVTETFDATADAPDQMQTALNAVKLAGSELINTVLTAAAPLIEDVVAAVKDAVAWFTGLDDGIKQIIVGVLGVLAVAGPLLSTIGKISSLIGVIVSHPILALIGAVVAGVIALYQNVEPFREFVNNLWNNYLVPFGTWLGETFLGIFSTLGTFFSETLIPILSNLGPIFSGLLLTMEPVGTWIRDTFGPAIEGIQTGLSEIMTFITDVFQGNWEGAWNAISSAFETVWNAFSGIAKKPLNAVIGFLNDLMLKVQSTLNTIITGINGLFEFSFGPIEMPGFIPDVPEMSFDLVNLPTITWFSDHQIPLLAKGGIVEAGSAIVGDAGPELLTMQGGAAYVQPLPGSGGYDNSAILAAMGEIADAVGVLTNRVDGLQVVMDSGALVGSIAPRMDNALAMRSVYRQRRI